MSSVRRKLAAMSLELTPDRIHDVGAVGVKDAEEQLVLIAERAVEARSSCARLVRRKHP